MNRSTLIGIIFLLLVPLHSLAKEHFDGIRVTNAWVRASYPGQQTGAVYMDIISEKNAALVKVETAVAKRAEMHNMEIKQSVMMMREVEAVDLPAYHIISFAPGSYHIMLMDLKQPLQVGDKVPLKLSIKRGSETIELNVEAQVRKK
jgi:periplasmic copper chaperone A